MVRAELKSLFSVDHLDGEGLASYEPHDATDFGVRVQAFIGTADDERSDSFDFVACSPSWLAEHYAAVRAERKYQSDEVVFGAGLVLMACWNYSALRAAVEELCARTEGPDWGSVASRIGRLLTWEFVGRYDQAVDAGESFPARRVPPPDA